jgi:short-subunit dehydrogenase
MSQQKRTWIIVGATSIIAQEFAAIAAKNKHPLVLVGRNKEQLSLIASDLQLRHKISCDILVTDLSKKYDVLLQYITNSSIESDLFLAHTTMVSNQELSAVTIQEVIHTNILSTIEIIHTYLQKKQAEHHLLFLSSVAALRGRAKNSLYGASKAAIEVYLQGLQQQADKNTCITIARLGFIDTRLTFGEPGVFYASPPEACARACWKAVKNHKRVIYHPFFWRYIMAIIRHLPFFIYKKMKV